MAQERDLNILLVDDDEIDIMNIQRAFMQNNITNPVTFKAFARALSKSLELRSRPPFSGWFGGFAAKPTRKQSSRAAKPPLCALS